MAYSTRYCIIYLFILNALTFNALSFHVVKAGFTRSFSTTKLCLGNNVPSSKDEIDSLRLDTSTLSDEERERLDYIQRVTADADKIIKSSGIKASDEETETIERAIIDTKWSGQSDVDIVQIETRTPRDILQRPLLAFGDIVALTIFASIGRMNHNEGIDIFSVLSTAGPFILSWLSISTFLGAYTRDATGSIGKIFGGLLPAWVVSIPAAIALRAELRQALPPVPFVIVSMVATLGLLYTWRVIYILAFGETSDEEYRKAGFFEIFKMIGTLIRRW